MFRGEEDVFEQKPQSDFFKGTNSDEAEVLYEVDPEGGHYFEKTQYVNALNHIYGKLDSSFTSLNEASFDEDSTEWTTDATLLKFDQSEFIHYD